MEQVIREQLLHMLENNSKLTEHEIAIMLGISEEEVQREIAGLEKAHVICGYHTLIDWNKVNDDDVTALVELRVTPQGGEGYQKLAEKINAYPQVVTLYHMSEFLFIFCTNKQFRTFQHRLYHNCPCISNLHHTIEFQCQMLLTFNVQNDTTDI